ncbi:hypothetical protein SUDANB1_03222 [Streptomyces sp. enrichment culture]|uniref:DUF397 domain-containing protein n=1 Tax=Streptomyces sp. enrichment culture TaxID=1795815 RepID=UPI003F55ECD5
MIRKASAEDVSELVWFKSSHSDGPDGNSCVEIAISPETATIHVRDSKYAAQGPRLALTPEAWSDFVAFV